MIRLKLQSEILLIICFVLGPVWVYGADFEFSYSDKQKNEKPSVIAAKGSIKPIESGESFEMSFEKSERRSGFYSEMPEQLYNIKFYVIDKKLHICFTENHNVDEWKNLIQIMLATSVLEVLGYADINSDFPVTFEKVMIKVADDEFIEYDYRKSFIDLHGSYKKTYDSSDVISYISIKWHEQGVNFSKISMDAGNGSIKEAFFTMEVGL